MKKATLSDPMPKQNLSQKWLVSWIKRPAIIEFLSILYVILFLYTGLSKIVDIRINTLLLEESPITRPFAGVLAWGIPIAEFIVAIALFFPRFRLKGLYAALSLMTVFTAYIIIMLTSSDDPPCSCGGVIQQLSWPQHIVFNLGFILLAATAIRLLRKEIK